LTRGYVQWRVGDHPARNDPANIVMFFAAYGLLPTLLGFGVTVVLVTVTRGRLG
jgi:hypothetical protein